MKGTTVGDALDTAIATNGKPVSITHGHGTAFTWRVLEGWAHARSVQRADTRSDKPTDDSCIESFNGTLCHECVNATRFADITHA